MQELPYSEACARNWKFIYEELSSHMRSMDDSLLEIGSGTGQHAVDIGGRLSQIKWQTADQRLYHSNILARLNLAKLANVFPPIDFEIGGVIATPESFDILYTANTLHIIAESLLSELFYQCKEFSKIGSLLCIYGPFIYKDRETSESNLQFHEMLKSRGLQMGLRKFEEIERGLKEQGFHFLSRSSLPANNDILYFERVQ